MLFRSIFIFLLFICCSKKESVNYICPDGDYLITDNFSIGVSYERGDYASLKFVYKNNPVRTYREREYTRAERYEGDNKYTQLINNLEENGIGVKKLTRSAGTIGLSLTQNIHLVYQMTYI